jgi:hypothetical protein
MPREKDTHEKSTLLKARNTVKLEAVPIPNPMVCAVEAYERFGAESSVRAHPARHVSDQANISDLYIPSTAISEHSQHIFYLHGPTHPALPLQRLDFRIPP